MSYTEKDIDRAKKLRLSGNSYNQIASLLNIPKGTIYTWTHKLILNSKALKKIDSRKQIGRQHAQQTQRQKITTQNDILLQQTMQTLTNIPHVKAIYQTIAACLYWAEGSKNQNSLIFTNSDPMMITLFLQTLRKCFNIDESKLRVLVHLHEYHDPQEVLSFWSKVTHIPLTQFTRPYHKPNTQTRIHQDYKGCCTIKYYDAYLAKLLTTTYRHLPKMLI